MDTIVAVHIASLTCDYTLVQTVRGGRLLYIYIGEICIGGETNVSLNQVVRENENMPQEKYSRIERERRFLLTQFPSNATVVRNRRITDNYIEGTTLRLRKQSYSDGLTTFKLTQKLPVRGNGAQQGFITSMYLTEDEFHVLAQLPARKLTKTRFSVPPFGIDVFDGLLQGLILAEAEFDSTASAESLTIPSFAAREVSTDDRFTGGQLVRASRQDVQIWLLDYGIALSDVVRSV